MAVNERMFYDWWARLQRAHRDEADGRFAQMSGGRLTATDTPSGTNVVNIAASSQADLQHVRVLDPIMLRTDTPAEYSPTTVNRPPALNYGYHYALVVAVGSTTLTLSEPLPNPVTTGDARDDHYASYAHTDEVHPGVDAVYSLHGKLWTPGFKLASVYLGDLAREVTNLTAGWSESGVARAGATYDPDEALHLPGRNLTADTIADLTFTQGGTVTAPGATGLNQNALHVARFQVVSKEQGGAGSSLLVEVIDADGTVLASTRPLMFGGTDFVDLTFKPNATREAYVRFTQDGATDASCYVSTISYRQIPEDGETDFATKYASGNVFLQGASNSLEAGPVYQDNLLEASTDPYDCAAQTGTYVSALYTPGRGYRDSLGGRDIFNQLAALNRIRNGEGNDPNGLHAANACDGLLTSFPSDMVLGIAAESANTVRNVTRNGHTHTVQDVVDTFRSWSEGVEAEGMDSLVFAYTRFGVDAAFPSDRTRAIEYINEVEADQSGTYAQTSTGEPARFPVHFGRSYAAAAQSEDRTATQASAFPMFSSASAASSTVPTYEADAAGTLPMFTSQSAAESSVLTYEAQSTTAFPMFTSSSSGTQAHTFAASQSSTFPMLASQSAGDSEAPSFTATAATLLPMFTSSASATLNAAFSGTQSSTLPMFTSESAAELSAPSVTASQSATFPMFRAALLGLEGFIPVLELITPYPHGKVRVDETHYWTQGDSFGVQVTFTGAPDLSGASYVMALYKDGAEVARQSGVMSEADQLSVTFTPAQTAEASGLHALELQLSDPSGAVVTPLKRDVRFYQDYIKE